jgi:arginine utilization protein RocB
MAVGSFYRSISDASYVAWRAEGPAALEAMLPGWGREYRLPVAECRALDLDVITIGPWGRDAHGLFERVQCRFAFETLPALIAGAAREAVRR